MESLTTSREGIDHTTRMQGGQTGRRNKAPWPIGEDSGFLDQVAAGRTGKVARLWLVRCG
jgi:hypothetical protein